MAEISGVDGSVSFTGSSGYVKSWTVSYTGDTLETTNFDSTSGARTYIPGLTGWSGSFDALYSTGNTSVPGTNATGSIVLKTSTGTVGTWMGDIIITGMDITTPKDGLVTQSYTFQGTGILAASTGA